MIANWYMPQGRIRKLLEPVVENLGRSGSPGSFLVEVMSDLKSEGDEGNIQREGTRTESLSQDHARGSEETSVAGVERVKCGGGRGIRLSL